jgi:hypothetical protein
VENQEYPQTVRLEGEDLGRTQRMREEVDASLQALAEFVIGQVHGKTRAQESRLKSAHIVFNNEVITFDDGSSCSAFEDPPGICRPCTDAELSSH